jgi:hypothetical protein
VGAETGITMMRKHLFLVFFLCASCISQSYQLNTPFDSLFPMTWYQKSLEASLLVWQKLLHNAENNIDPQLSSNELLGLLAQTLFYVDRMKQESTICMAEDKDYFIGVMNKIKSLLDMMVTTPENEDFVLCAQGMVLNIQQQI